MSAQNKKVSQWLWVIVVIAVVVILSAWALFSGKNKGEAGGEQQESADKASEDEAGHAHEEGEDDPDEDSHEEGSLELTAKQMVEFGLKLAQVGQGQVSQSTAFPAKLVVNTDQQAHVSSTFAGRIDQVNVNLGQQVQKGQALASLFIPELVDQQANLSMAQENLNLAQQEYQREKKLFDQGISARQDYQRAYNAYRQAQIQVQADRNRLNALGAGQNSGGRFVLTAPLSGVVSSKDVVVGEYISPTKQLFVIDQLDQLWLEFNLPNDNNITLLPNQQIAFKSLQSNEIYQAKVQTLNSVADEQTGRLVVRAKVLTPSQALRPNLMVNVLLANQDAKPVLRVAKSAIQEVEGKKVVFVAQQEKDQIHFNPVAVQLGAASSDGQWVEVQSGLSEKQQYVSQGSFLLKSQLEKGEAEHGH